MSLSQDAVIRACSRYLFETTWNAPADECGVNLQLYLANPRFLTNSLITNMISLPLPVPNIQYAVFWTSFALFYDSLIIPNDIWVNTKNVGNIHQTLFHVYTTTGLMVPKSSVYLYHSSATKRVYIAIQKTPLVQIVGLTNWTQLYLSVYRYSVQSNRPLTIFSGQVASPDTTHASAGAMSVAVIDALAACPHGTFVYINGYDHIASNSLTFNPGDYVDIYTDNTVINKFTVNLATTVASGYFSTKYDVYKEILHCPKSINPTNLILTTEMLTLTARRNSDNVGCLIHRNELNGITQVTHNDFAINTDIINAYRTSLGSNGTLSDITVEVRIRSHNNHLIRDASYIEYLYLLTDAQILTFLIGQGDPSLPFWAATALEQSAYVTSMSYPPALVNSTTLTSFVSSIGYYTTLAAICLYDKTYTIDLLPVVGISVQKPLVLSGLPVIPLVYLNGTKLKATQVNYYNTHQDKILFSLTSDVYAEIGQNLTVELIETGSSGPYLFTPSSGTPTITVPFAGVSVFQVNPLSTPVEGYQTSSANSYTQITPGPGAVVQVASTNANTILTFESGAYGITYLIQNTTFSRCYGADVTAQVTALEPVNMVLNTLCNDGTTIAPLLGYQTLAVYLNGRRMIPGIDFSANPICDVNNNPAVVQVIVTNKSALSLTSSNYLEVVAHTAIEIAKTVGYVTNNILNIKNNIDTWYAGFSEAFDNGYLLINPTDNGDQLVPTTPVANGLPYMVTATIPSYASSTLSSISSSADDARIGLINTYLNEQPPENNNNFIIIPNSWQVYSPYLTAIFHDCIQPGQVLIYTNDPDPVLFQLQFAAYNYLLKNDPALNSAISLLDLRYCDIFPTYNTLNVPDLNTYTILRRLASLLLPSDSDTLGEILNA